mgnify:CR=1 FL=1
MIGDLMPLPHRLPNRIWCGFLINRRHWAFFASENLLQIHALPAKRDAAIHLEADAIIFLETRRKSMQCDKHVIVMLLHVG